MWSLTNLKRRRPVHDKCQALPVFLDFKSTAIIPARNEEFAARDHFVEDTSASAKVKISHLGVGFRLRFIEDGGKVEQPSGSIALCSHRLLTESIDIDIISTLGGEDHVETTLWGVFSLMEKQPTGKSGDLTINNQLKNIFYIPDQHGVLCAVLASWYNPGWFIGAVDLTRVYDRRNRWGLENQVFTRADNFTPAYGRCPSMG